MKRKRKNNHEEDILPVRNFFFLAISYTRSDEINKFELVFFWFPLFLAGYSMFHGHWNSDSIWFWQQITHKCFFVFDFRTINGLCCFWIPLFTLCKTAHTIHGFIWIEISRRQFDYFAHCSLLTVQYSQKIRTFNTCFGSRIFLYCRHNTFRCRIVASLGYLLIWFYLRKLLLHITS